MGGGRRGGRGDEQGDDLRAYALNTDSRLGHRHVLVEAGEAGEEEDLPSLSLVRKFKGKCWRGGVGRGDEKCIHLGFLTLSSHP